jgi:hypothetical protein
LVSGFCAAGGFVSVSPSTVVTLTLDSYERVHRPAYPVEYVAKGVGGECLERVS